MFHVSVISEVLFKISGKMVEPQQLVQYRECFEILGLMLV